METDGEHGRVVKSEKVEIWGQIILLNSFFWTWNNYSRGSKGHYKF